MITIDCSKTLSIKDQMLVYVADKLEARPILKNDKFVLEPLNDQQKIDKLDVISAIAEFLESLDLKDNLQIIPKGDDIKLEPFGKDLKEKLENISTANQGSFFECTHCGFITQYETELKAHKVVHYL